MMTLPIDNVIRSRKTAKILRDPNACVGLSDELSGEMRQSLQDMIEVAEWAPFHKVANEQSHRCGQMRSVVPWRFYVLEKSACCKLLQFLRQQAATNADPKWAKAFGKKIPKLLAGCGALVQVTWLPEPHEAGTQPELSVKNMAHLAAASSAVQNLLLAAEARSLHNYWSSGGILKDPEIFDYLSIPRNQMLLSLFSSRIRSKPLTRISRLACATNEVTWRIGPYGYRCHKPH